MLKKIFLLFLGCISLLVGCNSKNTLSGIYVVQVDRTNDAAIMGMPAINAMYIDGINFNEDGTCSIIGRVPKCYYEYIDAQFVVTITEGIGDLQLYFDKIDNDTLIDKFDYTWKKSDDFTEDSTNEDSTKLQIGLDTTKDYFVVGTNTGKNAYIRFNKDGTCTPNFYALNNSGKLANTKEMIYVNYQVHNLDCTYNIAGDIISIDWLDTYEMLYEYKLGNGKTQRSSIGGGYIMKDIQFQYFSDEDIIDTINGSWKVTPGDNFFTVEFVLDNGDDNDESDKDIIDEDKKDDSEIIKEYEKEYDKTTTTTTKTTTTKKIKPVENIKVEITSWLYGYYYIDTSNDAYLKEMYVNGTKYNGDYLEFKNEGEHCYDIKLVDTEGNTREEKKCINFIAENPNVKVTYWPDFCYFYLANTTIHYNTLDKLDIFYNDVLIEESPYITSDKKIFNYKNPGYIYSAGGKYTIKFVNKYGKVTEEVIEFPEKCDTYHKKSS